MTVIARLRPVTWTKSSHFVCTMACWSLLSCLHFALQWLRAGNKIPSSHLTQKSSCKQRKPRWVRRLTTQNNFLWLGSYIWHWLEKQMWWRLEQQQHPGWSPPAASLGANHFCERLLSKAVCTHPCHLEVALTFIWNRFFFNARNLYCLREIRFFL